MALTVWPWRLYTMPKRLSGSAWVGNSCVRAFAISADSFLRASISTIAVVCGSSCDAVDLSPGCVSSGGESGWDSGNGGNRGAARLLVGEGIEAPDIACP